MFIFGFEFEFEFCVTKNIKNIETKVLIEKMKIKLMFLRISNLKMF